MIHEQTYQCDNCGKQERWPGDVAKSWSHVAIQPVNIYARRERVSKHACSTSCERAMFLAMAREPADAERLQAEAEDARPDLAAQIAEAKTKHDTEMAKARGEISRLTSENMGLRTKSERDDMLSRTELVEALRTALR